MAEEKASDDDLAEAAGSGAEDALDSVDVDLAGADTFVEEPEGFLQNKELLRQIAMVLILAVSLVIGVIILIWANEPKMRPYLNLDMEEMIPVLDVLDKHEIHYELKGKVLSVDERVTRYPHFINARRGANDSG